MKKQTFILKNHHREDNNITVEASLEIEDKNFKLEYQVKGEVNNYIFSKPSREKRANELWRATCFELFLAPKESLNYWELNLSPSKAWNFYAFDNYKLCMREEKNISLPIIHISQKKNNYSLSLKFNFDRELKEADFNLAVILLDREKNRHFYSINRKENGVDFHDRGYWSILTK